MNFLTRLRNLAGLRPKPVPRPEAVLLATLETYSVRGKHSDSVGIDHTNDMTLWLNRASMADVRNAYDEIKKHRGWVTRILERRLEVAEVLHLIDYRVLVFVMSQSDRPAKAVLWAYTLYRIQMTRRGQELYFSDLLAIFHRGWPSDEGYRQAWLDQKAVSSQATINLLDKQEQWQ